MSINKNDLRHIVDTTLTRMGMMSQPASDLIMGTIAMESCGGSYLRQIGGGPAAGVCQIEPATAADIVKRYMVTRPAKDRMFHKAFQVLDSHMIDWSQVNKSRLYDKLLTDVRFSVAVARVKYWMVPAPLPLPGEDYVYRLAAYWKEHYNTQDGAGEEKRFTLRYKRYVING